MPDIEVVNRAGDPPRVAVVADTTTYAPAQMLDALDVRRVSLYVGWGDEQLPEAEMTDLDAFYAKLRDSDTLPTTSQPSVGDFLEVYEPLVNAGRDVYSIHIAEGLSGTCASAREAASRLADAPGRIEVVDGRTGAGGLGCLVLLAAEGAQRGLSLEQIGAEVERAHSSLDIWFCLDTLEYLRRGGRIGAAQALLGSALRIKPILTFGTEIAPVGKVRTHSRAIARMEEYLDELAERGVSEWIVQHAQSADDAERLVTYGESVLGCPPRFCTQVGPVLGAHLGVGLLVGGIGPTERAD